MKKEIEILDMLHFIECFMYGNYDNVTIRYKSGREVFAEQAKIDELKKIDINDIRRLGVYRGSKIKSRTGKFLH